MPRSCALTRQVGDEFYFRSCAGDEYFCHPHHRSPAFVGKKSQWAHDRPDECHFFCEAQILAAITEDGDLWLVSDQADVVFGQAEERLAFFESGANSSTPWHGYPVGGNRPKGKARRPSVEMIVGWRNAGRIPKHVADKMIRGVL